jgi:hypothetical protein
VWYKYSNPSVYEQSVYEFSLIRDAHINTCFSICEPFFACMSSFLSQADRCSRSLFSGSNGKLIFVLRVFALRAVLEDRIKLVNRGIPVSFHSCFANSSYVTLEKNTNGEIKKENQEEGKRSEKEDSSQMEDCLSFFNPLRCCPLSLSLKSVLTCCFVSCFPIGLSP